MKKIIISLISLLSVLVWAERSSLCFARELPVPYSTEAKIQKIKRIAAFPLINIAGNMNAPVIVNSQINNYLEKRGFELVPYDELYYFLNKNRIRNTGSIDKVSALRVRRDLNADVVLLGSIDQYSSAGGRVDAYMGLTLRLVATGTCSIVWMDTLSYAGDDFMSVLQFGSVKSAKELSKRVVANLLKDIPGRYVEKGSATLYEVGKVKISSPITSGGKPVKLSVNIESFDKKPVSVKVHVNEKIYDLKEGGKYYKGEIVTPLNEGAYCITLDVQGADGKMYEFNVGDVTVDVTPPKLKIGSNKYAMRGLSKKDHILFTITADRSVSKWEAEIVNADNKVVRTGKGFESVPRTLIWRGETDNNAGSGDGVYTLRIKVWDKAGNFETYQREVRLDATPPVVSIDVSAVENNKVVFVMQYDENELMESWELIVRAEDSKIIKEIRGKGNIDNIIDIAIPDEIMAKGSKIMYTFNVKDMAGNTFEVSQEKMVFAGKKERKFTLVEDGGTTGWGIEDF